MKIHLIRHGRTAANEQGLYYGSTDLPLSERGVVELYELKKSISFPVADIYVTSGLRRAKESLAVLYDKVPERTVPELNEFDFGDFEMKTYEELRDRPDFRHWISGGDDSSCPNGESKNRFVERILKGWDIVRRLDAESVVVLCHGGVIGAVMEALFPGKKEHYYAWVPDCGQGYSLDTLTNTYKPISHSKSRG